MCNFDPKIGIFRAKSQLFVLKSRFLPTGHITSIPGATTFPFRPPQKNSVSELWVIFRGSPLFLAVSGHSPITSKNTINFGPFSTKLGGTENDQE